MSSENNGMVVSTLLGHHNQRKYVFMGDHSYKHFHLIGLVLLNYMYLEHLKLFNTIIHRSANFKSQILFFLIKITSFEACFVYFLSYSTRTS